MQKVSLKVIVINKLGNSIILSLLVYSNSHASWLCREASSLAENDYFYSCGVASSDSLNDARRNALNNAKEEFNTFCDESYNCKNNEYIITPLRTDCTKKSNVFTCYRGIQYRLLDKKREHSTMSLFQLKAEIIRKEKELSKINDRIGKIEKIEQLQIVKEELNESDNTTLELEKFTNTYNQKLSSGLFAFTFQSLNLNIYNQSQQIFGIGLEYQRFLFKDYLGYAFNISYLTGCKNKHDLENRGTPNTTSNSSPYSFSGYDLSFSLPFHIQYMSITPKLGYLSVSYDVSSTTYNNFGASLNPQTERNNFNKSYYGINFRYGNRFYGEIEPRKYSNQDDIQTLVGVGIKIDF